MKANFTAKDLNELARYATDDELDYIKALVESRTITSKDSVVMIGAGPGVFALALMEQRQRPPTLFIVDIGTFQWVDAHLIASEADMGSVHYLQGDSSEVGQEWQGKINLLIVDGDHSYEGVKKDLEAWLPHVVVGGYVFLHDWLERPGGFNGIAEWEESGVAEAGYEIIAPNDDWELVRDVGISRVYRRV